MCSFESEQFATVSKMKPGVRALELYRLLWSHKHFNSGALYGIVSACAECKIPKKPNFDFVTTTIGRLMAGEHKKKNERALKLIVKSFKKLLKVIEELEKKEEEKDQEEAGEIAIEHNQKEPDQGLRTDRGGEDEKDGDERIIINSDSDSNEKFG